MLPATVFFCGRRIRFTERVLTICWFQMLRTFSANPMITFYLASSYFEHYDDRDPAYRHFRLFLEQSTREDQEPYREYAMSRIREITEERHFRGE